MFKYWLDSNGMPVLVQYYLVLAGSTSPVLASQYFASAVKPVLVRRYHPRIPPVQAPVLIVSTAPVSGSTGTVLRPLLKSDWPVWKNLLALASPRLDRLIRARLESRRSRMGLANARRFFHTGRSLIFPSCLSGINNI